MQPLNKDTVTYDLEGTLEKVDLVLRKFEFTEPETEVIVKFQECVRAKY